MIHILLMILKVIGVILLVILGLILAAVLLILFVPVRYRADVSFEGKPDGEAAVSWLLHLVRIRVSYHEHADVSGRVLWFKLFDVRLWPPEDEETEGLDFEPESAKTEVTAQKPVFTETVNQDDVPEPVVVAKPEPERTAEANVPTVRTDSKDDEELTVHATELSSKFDEPQKNETEDFSSDENTDKIRFSVKIKEKLSRIIKKLCTFFDKLRGLPGKFQKLVDGISK